MQNWLWEEPRNRRVWWNHQAMTKIRTSPRTGTSSESSLNTQKPTEGSATSNFPQRERNKQSKTESLTCNWGAKGTSNGTVVPQKLNNPKTKLSKKGWTRKVTGLLKFSTAPVAETPGKEKDDKNQSLEMLYQNWELWQQQSKQLRHSESHLK